MVKITCLSPNDPNAVFEYCPSFPAAIIFAILFGLATITHLVQAVQYRKAFCWVLIMASIWETAGYSIRAYNITDQSSSGIYTAQFLLILLAPLWINAFVYMILGRMIHFFLVKDRVFGLRARRITLIFVLFDITAFVVQLTGGLMSSGTDVPVNQAKTGLRIYTGGVGLQLAFIAVFCGIAVKFWQLLKAQSASERYGVMMEDLESGSKPYNPAVGAGTANINYLSRTSSQATPLLVGVAVALGLIIVRNIYRLIEYGVGGVNGNVMTKHEWFQYVFDAVLMLAAMVVLAWQHPGKTLQGERSDFSVEDKQRKQEKKAKKQEKKDLKAAKKGEKTAQYVPITASNNSSNEQLVTSSYDVRTGRQ